jgi:hypothetical protein
MFLPAMVIGETPEASDEDPWVRPTSGKLFGEGGIAFSAARTSLRE